MGLFDGLLGGNSGKSAGEAAKGVAKAAVTTARIGLAVHGGVAHPQQSSSTTQHNYASYAAQQQATNASNGAQSGTVDRGNRTKGTSGNL